MLIEPLDHALMHNVAAVDAILQRHRSAKALLQRIVLKRLQIEQHIAGALGHRQLQRLIVDFATFREQIFGARIDAVPMEIM